MIGRVFRWTVLLIVLVGLAGPIVAVAIYRFAPPPLTFLMVERMVEGHGFDRRWVPLSRISPQLVRSVIGAEDARFCEHHGFDWIAIRKAITHNEQRPGRVRGGSTISQQTAKNVFLWPQRNWVRKGLETWFTVLIEALWGKARIMEVYLNSIEWGPGVYGAEAAAQANFNVSAARLSPAQAARLAAIIPKPLSWKAARPGPYIQRRGGHIAAAAGTVRRDGLADCVL
ncbi:monofunctional biosynthetic peptidoglycan transglycosylase [Phenylobacterium sp.]|uniref:monofunctional biosynthetic peptidoglycan transglycosylase n=1 Tax=Phenylobacterium sp. TaxID=1871053 RepID=UPI00286CE323|nr:monofunctional biosynthetic peptidoglycan transglycosylase [Phenylobacterium sp.]